MLKDNNSFDQITTPATGGSPSRSVTRRTIAKGVAWTAPAVILAPSAAAYSTSAPNIKLTGLGAKLPGNSCHDFSFIYTDGYRFYFNAYNPPGKAACLVFTAFTVNGGTPPQGYHILTTGNEVSTGCPCAPEGFADKSIGIAPDTTVQFVIDAGMTSSSDATLAFEYDIYNADADGECKHDFGPLSGGMIYKGTKPGDTCLPYCTVDGVTGPCCMKGNTEIICPPPVPTTP